MSDLWVLIPPSRNPALSDGQREVLTAAAKVHGFRFATFSAESGFVPCSADGPAASNAWDRASLLFRRLAHGAARTPAPPAPFAAGDILLVLGEMPASAWDFLRSLRDELRLIVLAAGDRPMPVADSEAWGQSRLAARADLPFAISIAVAVRSAQGDGYEQRLQHLYTGWLRDGDVGVDVGAHVGRHAFPMAACVGPGGRVLAFEPNPRVFPVLQSRLAALGLANVSTMDVALSDSAGEADFVIAVDRAEESGLRERQYDGATRLEHVRVKLTRLDDIAPAAARFIKIDTEGAEFNVLLGARETLRRLRPLVSFEFGENSYRAYGVDPVAVHRYLSGMDYALLSIFGDALDEPTFVRHSREQTYWDYVASPADHAAQVQAILRSYAAAPISA